MRPPVLVLEALFLHRFHEISPPRLPKRLLLHAILQAAGESDSGLHQARKHWQIGGLRARRMSQAGLLPGQERPQPKRITEVLELPTTTEDEATRGPYPTSLEPSDHIMIAASMHVRDLPAEG